MPQKKSADQKLLKAPDLAVVLDLTTQAVHRYARLGRIPAKRLGRQRRFSLPEVLAALDGDHAPDGPAVAVGCDNGCETVCTESAGR